MKVPRLLMFSALGLGVLSLSACLPPPPHEVIGNIIHGRDRARRGHYDNDRGRYDDRYDHRYDNRHNHYDSRYDRHGNYHGHERRY